MEVITLLLIPTLVCTAPALRAKIEGSFVEWSRGGRTLHRNTNSNKIVNHTRDLKWA